MDFANDLPGSVEEVAEKLPVNLLIWIVIAIVAAAVLYFLWKATRPRKPATERRDTEPPIEVSTLPKSGPPLVGPALEFYNVKVRLAAVVLAPAGAARELPPRDRLDEMFESVVPGLAQVVAAHRPLVQRWSSQVSTAGFPHRFFAKAKLPSDGGKGTPWCSAAGVFSYQDQPFLIGLVMCADGDNSQTQYTVDHPAKWVDLLRIKRN